MGFTLAQSGEYDWTIRVQGRNHVFKVGGVQFLGLGYCTEQNTDGRPISLPSFVHCSLLRNGNHTLHQKSWVVRPNFVGVRPPTLIGCALVRVRRRCGLMLNYFNQLFINVFG